ncbi:MAG: FUSC family protein [Flavobacteriales bacterium]|nr:FUSC family protein [Flavobacteriales bacterium]
MRPYSLTISENYNELKQFLKSTSFSRAILVGIAVTLPIIIGLQLGYFEIGLAICFGAFWCSPSDISGSFQHKKIGILISSALIMLVSFIGSYLHYETWLSLPILGILSFCIAYISIYGFRASLIAFSGLLAMVISLGHSTEHLEIYQFALLVGVGGLWYLLLIKIWHSLNPKAETEELLSKTYKLTANFIHTRGKLIGPHKDRKTLQSKLLRLQSELIENHETLREILILSRKTSGLSNYQDKRLLVFVQLVEMLETAVANPVNYERMDLFFKEHPKYIKVFQDLIFEMSRQLELISEAGHNKSKLPKNDQLRLCFETVRHEISSLHEKLSYEEFLMLKNLFAYQEKQFKKLKRIKWLLGDPNLMEIELIDSNTAKRFVTAQDNDPKLLVRNFSFKSSIFRHSLRLAFTVMVGYTLGSIFPFQNPYWILLTIIVIMRPSYGLTKRRAKDRMVGTLIGGLIAYGMIFLIHDLYLYGAIGIASLVIALSLIQKNSRASAIFITLSVVFIYAILSTDVLTVIKFRVIDTLVGAGLSFMAMLWLWPSWESVEMNESIEKSIKANKDFLNKITEYYQRKGNVPTSYNIARKEAFVETSNLNSAFQRMAQEPKSKQSDMDRNYELVVLNHNFLASLASVSSFIQQHKTTEASDKFRNTIAKIDKNLDLSLQCLNDHKCKNENATSVNEAIFEELLPNLNLSEIYSLVSKDKEIVHDLQEAHLIWEQLQWMFSMSVKMLKLVSSVK